MGQVTLIFNDEMISEEEKQNSKGSFKICGILKIKMTCKDIAEIRDYYTKVFEEFCKLKR